MASSTTTSFRLPEPILSEYRCVKYNGIWITIRVKYFPDASPEYYRLSGAQILLSDPLFDVGSLQDMPCSSNRFCFVARIGGVNVGTGLKPNGNIFDTSIAAPDRIITGLSITSKLGSEDNTNPQRVTISYSGYAGPVQVLATNETIGWESENGISTQAIIVEAFGTAKALIAYQVK